MNLARIVNGIVDGIEIADQDWLDSNVDKKNFYVEIPENLIVNVGSSWSHENGFDDSWTKDFIHETGVIIGERTDGLQIDDEIEAILAGE